MTNEDYTRDNGGIYRGKSSVEEERKTDNEEVNLWKKHSEYYLDRMESKR
tara:strand:- start:1548 stop:1697 length:150 start_codon:yes stop_codon:yes gene_type:complete